MRYNVFLAGRRREWFYPRRTFMDAMSSMIAANLKRIRKEKKLSLDNAAEMTGVSKSMLGQIERGESSQIGRAHV